MTPVACLYLQQLLTDESPSQATGVQRSVGKLYLSCDKQALAQIYDITQYLLVINNEYQKINKNNNRKYLHHTKNIINIEIQASVEAGIEGVYILSA